MPAEHALTERQQKWFAAVRDGLERDTGKTLDEWVAIAMTCPETAHRARLRWFKENHGLMQNRASMVLSTAFPSPMGGWSEADGLREALWTDPASHAIYEAVKEAAEALPEIVTGQRKVFSAWSRKVQFAAVRPVKGGTAMLGLHVPLDADPRLEAPKREAWSERLTARLALVSPEAVDESVAALLKKSWDAS
jgi:hypothetical protein